MKEKLVSACIVFVMVSVGFAMLSAPEAGGFPLQEHVRYGTYSPTGSAGQDISVWVDGVDYSITLSQTYGTDKYSAHCFGDESELGGGRIYDYKQGGRDGETIYYGKGPLGSLLYANEVSTFAAGSYEPDNLDFTVAQPEPLVINGVISDATTYPGNDYLFVFNPTGSLVTLSDYRISKNDGLLNTALVTLSGTVSAGQNKYVDLGGDVLSSSGDEVKLVWTGGANDLVIDRVEWGNQLSIPDDTIMLDVVGPGAGNALERAVEGVDTNDCAADFVNNVAQRERLDYPITDIIPWAPRSMVASINGNEVEIDWIAPLGPGIPTGYRVYYDNDFDLSNGHSKTLAPSGDVAGLTWDGGSAGHASDTNDYYYRIYAYNGAGESLNWTSAYAMNQELLANSLAWNWVSIPYNHGFTTLSDIVAAVGDTIPNDIISEVAIWDPVLSGFALYKDVGAIWIGNNAVIPAGAGIMIKSTGLDDPLNWKVVGTHNNATEHSLLANSLAWNWVSIPYDHEFTTLSDIVADIGDTIPNDIISEVAIWDPVLSGFALYKDVGAIWIGNNAVIPAGASIMIKSTGLDDPLMWKPETLST